MTTKNPSIRYDLIIMGKNESRFLYRSYGVHDYIYTQNDYEPSYPSQGYKPNYQVYYIMTPFMET